MASPSVRSCSHKGFGGHILRYTVMRTDMTRKFLECFLVYKENRHYLKTGTKLVCANCDFGNAILFGHDVLTCLDMQT